MERFICIHCHFYQPPRENPWLAAIEQQDSASPYHDWNERVAAECYAPNSAARILDGNGRIAKISNNYSRISFNFAPTLLSWLEEKAPWTYEQILRADRESRLRFGGHGAALAQAYNHIILPLANSRDKYTQIAWGIRDFQHRFQRDPEGMWLPETAVDLETLEILSSSGIAFTVLAPHQARRFRRSRWEEFIDCDEAGLDPTCAYVCPLPSGRTINLFFYDGPISRAVAFEKLLSNGEEFANRLLSGFHDQRPWPQLMHIATDGETYGHHHVHGDMALAYALEYIETHELAEITNYGHYLERCPSLREIQITENTSWSCMHGIARWETDCGCNSGEHGSWNQQWRRPMRDALDFLRDQINRVYAVHAPDLLLDPWAARDDYIHVVLDRSPANVDRFLSRHQFPDCSAVQSVTILKLLELQRHLMLMYTSCGWFFDELTGLETVQILQYAARALQLARESLGCDLEQDFLFRLEAASSNIAEFGNGRRVYERFVRPSMLVLTGIAAHFAISSLFDGYEARTSLYCYDINLEASRVLQSGNARLALGAATACSRITRESLTAGFVVVHFGDHNLTAGVREINDAGWLSTVEDETSHAFSAGELAECLRAIDRHFAGNTFSLKSLVRDHQRRLVDQILGSTISEAESVYRQVYEHHAPLMSFLAESNVPLPGILRVTTNFVLDRAIRKALEDPDINLDRIRSIMDVGVRHGVEWDVDSLQFVLRQRLNALVDKWAFRPGDRDLLAVIESIVSLIRVLPFDVDLWKVQNVYYQLLQTVSAQEDEWAHLGSWSDHFIELGEQLGLVVPINAAYRLNANGRLPMLSGSANA